MEAAVRTSDCFLFKNRSYVNINNENFTPCEFYLK